MDLKLAGKLALVTGSTAGIGKGIAKALLQEGAVVFVNGRSEKTADAAVAELSAFGDCRPAVGDVTTAEGAQAVIDAVDAACLLYSTDAADDLYGGVYGPGSGAGM